jgi:hypothetical protein
MQDYVVDRTNEHVKQSNSLGMLLGGTVGFFALLGLVATRSNQGKKLSIRVMEGRVLAQGVAITGLCSVGAYQAYNRPKKAWAAPLHPFTYEAGEALEREASNL